MNNYSHPIDLEEQLANPKNYEESILRIYSKRGQRGLAFNEADRGVSYFNAAAGRRALSTAIARDIVSGSYLPQPVDLWFLERGDRRRAAHTATYTDQVVGSVLFRLLTHNAQHLGLPGVFSYLPGKSNIGAMRAFAEFVRAHRKRHGPHPPSLYVLQSDFARYGDDLPVGPEAAIWTILRDVAACGSSSGSLHARTWDLIVDLVRPTVRNLDGATFTRVKGVAMGTPLVPLVGNLAVLPMDKVINSVPGAFYARYNDDFIVAHSDVRVLRELDVEIDFLLEGLGVKRKVSKDLRTALSGSGKGSRDDPRYIGRDRIDALGLTVGYTGTVSLGTHRNRRFIEDIARRIDASAIALDSSDERNRAFHLVGAVNTMLDTESPFAIPGLIVLLSTTTDRGVLKDLDFRIARKIVQVVTRVPGNRGFRRISIENLRRELGLLSLVHLRNLR